MKLTLNLWLVQFCKPMYLQVILGIEKKGISFGLILERTSIFMKFFGTQILLCKFVIFFSPDTCTLYDTQLFS